MSRALSLVSTLIALWCVWVMGSWVFASFIGHVEAGPAIVIRIDHPLSSQETAEKLQSTGILSSARGYRIYVFLARTNGAKTGSYELRPGISYREIARLLARGPERIEQEVRVIEGWDIRDEAAQLANWNPTWKEAFFSLAGQSVNVKPFDPKWRAEFAFLRSLPNARSLDGYLFPDTYRVWQDEMPENLIRKQLQTFDQKVHQPFKDATIPDPLINFDQVITLASIVEKEVPSAVDRKMVAGIFLHRLNLGMALQSDATLTYLTNSKRDRASQDDLALTNQYNSYKHVGLPPSPISQPAFSAIEAVLHPTQTKNLYFLTDKQGKVLYASTFEEHIRNRQKAGY